MKSNVPGASRDELLAGAIDLHVHAAPDVVARHLDDIALAGALSEAGAAGAVLKSHVEPTAGRAFLARRAVPGAALFGGLVLNRSVGGLNPAAVEAFAGTADGLGRIVWLPTRDAEHEVRVKRRANATVAVVRDGRPVDAFRDVADAIAATDLTLATGHVAPEEALLLFAEARARGCRRLLLTHVTAPISDYSLEQLDRAADLGALLEVSARNVHVAHDGAGDELVVDAGRVARMREVMTRYGAGRVVLSSDLGDPAYPPPLAGLATAARALLAAGVDAALLRAALVDTPRALLGLDAAQPTAWRRT